MGFFPVIIGRRRIVAAAEPSYEAETTALVAAMSSAPDSTRQGHINTLIAALKTAGVWSKMGVLYVFAAHASQAALLNWKSPAGTAAVATGSPTFTTDRGYTGDATAAHVDSQVAWNAISGVTQNNAHLGAYIHFGGTNGATALGIAGAATVTMGRSSGLLGSRLNNTTAVNADAVPASAGTHLLLSRSGSTQFERYIDGAGVTVGAQTSTTPPTGNLTALRQNATYAASTTSIRAMHAGSALTAGEAAAARSAIHAYMAAVGAS